MVELASYSSIDWADSAVNPVEAETLNQSHQKIKCRPERARYNYHPLLSLLSVSATDCGLNPPHQLCY
jgi:hypothetical protein